MSATIARPYAKAAFEYALNAHQLKEWGQWLNNAAELVRQAEVKNFLLNPGVADSVHHQFFVEALKLKNEPAFSNFLQVLTEKRRLIVLPNIAKQFAKLVAEYEKQVDVHVTSAHELTEQEINELKLKLENRLHRKVIMHTTVQAEILGGAIIRADDLVIDGSVLGRLEKLKERLKGNFLCN